MMIYKLMDVAYVISLLTLAWFTLDYAWDTLVEDEETWNAMTESEKHE